MINNEKKLLLNETIKNDYCNITGLIILKNGEIEYENYFQEYKKDEMIHVASVAKSITSILVGIAIDNGYIHSVEDNILDYFPEVKLTKRNEVIKQITIKDLLTMRVPYKCKYEPYTKVYSSDDWVLTTLNLIGGKGKIGDFRYLTAGVQILSGIIRKTTGLSLREFANQYLFEKLSIAEKQKFTINSKEEHLAYIKERGVAKGWIEDKNGVSTGGWGIPLTVEEMSKIGQLCLNKGIYKGQRIVSESWLKESISNSKEVSLFGKTFQYGYYWWIIDDLKYPTINALGDSGNVICCIPKLNLVIAIASSFYPRAKDRLEFINNYIIPLFETD